MNMELELNKNIADDLSILSPPRTFDDSIGGKVFQVQHGDHHGPVYNFGTVEDLKPYSGSRTCGCNLCQAHVQPHLKKN